MTKSAPSPEQMTPFQVVLCGSTARGLDEIDRRVLAVNRSRRGSQKTALPFAGAVLRWPCSWAFIGSSGRVTSARHATELGDPCRSGARNPLPKKPRPAIRNARAQPEQASGAIPDNPGGIMTSMQQRRDISTAAGGHHSPAQQEPPLPFGRRLSHVYRSDIALRWPGSTLPLLTTTRHQPGLPRSPQGRQTHKPTNTEMKECAIELWLPPNRTRNQGPRMGDGAKSFGILA